VLHIVVRDRRIATLLEKQEWVEINPGEHKRSVTVDRIEYAQYAYQCCDCHQYPTGFMVHDKLWKETMGHEAKGYICLACFQKKLGRPLEAEDFKTEVPLNQPIFFGYGMAPHSHGTPRK